MCFTGFPLSCVEQSETGASHSGHSQANPIWKNVLAVRFSSQKWILMQCMIRLYSPYKRNKECVQKMLARRGNWHVALRKRFIGVKLSHINWTSFSQFRYSKFLSDWKSWLGMFNESFQVVSLLPWGDGLVRWTKEGTEWPLQVGLYPKWRSISGSCSAQDRDCSWWTALLWWKESWATRQSFLCSG